MNIKEVFEAFDYEIISGSDFKWFCWPNARSINFSKSIKAEIYGTVRYKPNHHETIYEITLENGVELYRWVNPKYSKEYFDEYAKRGLDPHVLYNEVKWTYLSYEDILTKAKEYFVLSPKSDKNLVEVELELEDELFTQLAIEAHKRDITINQMVELILKNLMIENQPKSDIEHSKYWHDTERNK